jgi:RNA polymerase sigma-54 factor
LIQQFDPPVFAQKPPGMFMLQLVRLQADGRMLPLRLKWLKNTLMSSLKNIMKKITRLNISDDELKDVINLILKLNPRPGGNVGEINKAESYIIPDFFIINNAGKLELTLNSKMRRTCASARVTAKC